MRKGTSFLMCVVILLSSCQSGEIKHTASLSPQEEAAKSLDSLKQKAQAGDLIVRLGDDILSYQIKFLNEKDQSFSHAGIIVENGHKKLVAHISPEDSTKNTVQYLPIDSFLNLQKNLAGALYRYDFSSSEKAAVNETIDRYRKDGVRFDRLYDLSTDDKMYCSEMISKAISHATANRVQFRQVTVPKRMQPLLVKYFKGQLSAKTIATRKIMTIDNLYNPPACKKIVQVSLKKLPGQ